MKTLKQILADTNPQRQFWAGFLVHSMQFAKQKVPYQTKTDEKECLCFRFVVESQHEDIVRALRTVLGCGSERTYRYRGGRFRYVLVRRKHIVRRLFPFLDSLPLYGKKAELYKAWRSEVLNYHRKRASRER